MVLGKNKEICESCGGYCCSLGGTAATKDEWREILRVGHSDHFIRISKNCYITEWGEEGICPYLDGRSCSIYEVRPCVCRKFPVVTVNKREHFIAHCRLSERLSGPDLRQLIELSIGIPDEIIAGCAEYWKPHAAVIAERIQKFDLERIVQIL